MTGALLRSGKISSFKALGKTGQPVYRAALQLRNAIQRKNKLDALCLAIPQPDQQGDNIDWYSPVAGDVIPWSSATEEERAVARLRLEEVKSGLTAMRSELLASATANLENSSKDKQVFEQLLEYVIRFPGEEFVYLVRSTEGSSTANNLDISANPISDNGVPAQAYNLIPVLTFWGFVHADDALGMDPLYCLYPQIAESPPVAPLAAASMVAPTVASAAPVASAPELMPVAAAIPWWRNWRRWLWLLLALLLLLLTLFLLRGCMPSMPSLGKLGAPSMPAMPNLPTAPKMPAMPSANLGLPSLPSMPALPNGDLAGLSSLPSGSLPSLPDVNLPTPELAMGVDEAEALSPPALDADLAPELEPLQEPTDLAPPALPDELVEAPLANEPLMPEENIPTENKATENLADPAPVPANSAVDFLNGNWQAKGGIQDKRTGKPLRLEYKFNNGQGDVTVRRNDGVSCTGPVSAVMNNAVLAINSQGQAKCGDGGVYDMPAVSCKPDAKNMADCTGSYGNEFFPMTMQNAGE
ncbi:SrfA family protein [Oceanisphaera sp. W20_SRM_FM3]|uniref:SrfA family protein n=1 Tax=Oceanisphaera sp. W20_SRM_FM3 TaxID=3240267 RepID=UPI003F96DC15